MKRLFLLLILVLAAAATAPTTTPAVHATASVNNPLYFSHVVWIVMENHALSQIVTGASATNGSLAYQLNMMNSSAAAYNLGYESTSGSLPNYLSMIAGSCSMASGCTCDSNPNVCGGFTNTNLVDSFETNGISWKGYMEGMPQTNICNSGGTTDGGTHYITHHNPFVYFSDIATDSGRCQKVVPAGSYGGLVTCDTSSLQSNVAGTLISDLANRATAPDFAFVVPNNYDNTHDCVLEAAGNNWLKTIIPQILSSDTFIATPSAIVVTYDEATDNCLCEPIYTVWTGPQAQTQFTLKTPLCGASVCSYNHYSILRTIEDNWGLAYLTANDQNALSMGAFLYSYPATTTHFDQIGFLPDSTCSTQSGTGTLTLTMPASTLGQVTIYGVLWASQGPFIEPDLGLKLRDNFGVNLKADIANRQVVATASVAVFYGFSGPVVSAGTISIPVSGSVAHCSLVVYYMVNTGLTVCGVSTCPANQVAACCSNTTPVISSPSYGTAAAVSIELGIVGDTSSHFWAAESGFKCMFCEGESNSSIFTGLEYNVTSSLQSAGGLSFGDYNGKGASLGSDLWIFLGDGLSVAVVAPPPSTGCPSSGCTPISTGQPNNFAFNASSFKLGPFNITLPYQLTQLQALELIVLFPVAVVVSSETSIQQVPIVLKLKRAKVDLLLTAALTTGFDYVFHLTLTSPMEIPVYFVAKFIVAYLIARWLVPRLGILLSAAAFTLSFDVYYAVGVLLLHIPGLSSSPNQIIEIAGFGSACLGYTSCDLGTEGALLLLWTLAHGFFFFAAAELGKRGIPQPNRPIVLRGSENSRRASLV